ncbi:MAG: hypothetical protein Q6363_005960 [Candidatus Njordarchaeota archaeon]
MSEAMEIILTYLTDKFGGKCTFSDLYSITKIPKKSLRKFLWYCQRRKLMKRDIGVYYITDLGKKTIDNVPIIELHNKIYILATSGKVHMITLGKKMRIRSFDNEFLRKILETKCLSRNEIKESPNRRQLAAAIRLFRLLRMVRMRDDTICIEPNRVILKKLGII